MSTQAIVKFKEYGAVGNFTKELSSCSFVFQAKGADIHISDGYHTMDELYDHRSILYIAMCKSLHYLEFAYPRVTIEKDNKKVLFTPLHVWRSRLHSDGTSYKGMFVLGVGTEEGKQITYHLDDKYWELTAFAETLNHGPEFDGHSSEDVLERISTLI